MVPSPTSTFTIPSVHDDADLECRLYHPRHEHASPKRGAVFAHPYTPLGGCFDDRVVLSVVSVLLDNGYIVGTFNFRGAGASKGKTSWSSRPELTDYISYVGFFLFYIDQISSLASLPTSPTGSVGTPIRITKPLLLIGGYSYGALLTIQLPSLQAITNRFQHATKGSAEAEIRLRAKTMAKQRQQSQPRGRRHMPSSLSPSSPTLVYGGEESEPGTRRVSRDSRRSVEILRRSMDRSRKRLVGKPTSEDHLPRDSHEEMPSEALVIPRLRFLLISPLLPPVAWFIALSTPSLAFLSGQSKPHKEHSESNDEDKLYRNRTLAVYGNRDGFTSAKRLRKWSAQLEGMTASDFRSKEVDGIGHFWLEHSADIQLRAAIAEWLASDAG